MFVVVPVVTSLQRSYSGEGCHPHFCDREGAAPTPMYTAGCASGPVSPRPLGEPCTWRACDTPIEGSVAAARHRSGLRGIGDPSTLDNTSSFLLIAHPATGASEATSDPILWCEKVYSIGVY